MFEQYYINQVNSLIKEFRDKKYDVSNLQTSLAVAILLIQKYQLANQYNELMQIFENSKIITVDVIDTQN